MNIRLDESQLGILRAGERNHLFAEIDPDAGRRFDCGQQATGAAAELDDPGGLRDEMPVDLGQASMVVAAFETTVGHFSGHAGPVSLARAAEFCGFVGHPDSSSRSASSPSQPRKPGRCSEEGRSTAVISWYRGRSLDVSQC